MVHALYSNKEIFLRELISNASDAADKLRFQALGDEGLYESESDLWIRVKFDKLARTITVSDNGIGMNREEAVEQLGTIAKSGTRDFFKALTGDQAKDLQLIGQFGVGFYSSFIVSDRVTVASRRAGLGPEHGVRWDSTGEGDFTVATIERMSRGTDVTLHLREGEDEFLDPHRLRGIIARYSDHISIPIYMAKDDKGTEDEVVNSATALWARPRQQITEEEYNQFYKHVAHDFDDPLAHVHSRIEGTLEYTSLLFVPSRAPFDIWDRRSRRGVKLYVRRVFIMDDAEQLMPPYLRFVRGVVDCSDLPLNISREILQQNRQIESIRSGSVKRVLGLLDELAKNETEKYRTFWNEFGKVFKEGIIDDPKNQESIARLLRFTTSQSDSERANVSLDEYVERMQEGQEKIFYITAESYAKAKNSPHLEVFASKGIEVLLLTDEIDEWLVTHLTEYDNKPMQAVTKGELDLGTAGDKAEEQQAQDATGDFEGLIAQIKKVLDHRVKDVRLTYRLTASPACLVSDEHEMGAHMERILKAAGQDVPATKRILELNPDHPIIARLKGESDETRVSEWAQILFDQALLSEGGQPEDPAVFVKRLNDLYLELLREKVS
jgi:molecular chaperone HtpG